ncbi:MAG: hypothetical protein IPN95_16670 [Bacteroidetes bacterium]|nr:hypothetical protein [Bacteroidota bacterium]MBP6720736.1 hypothetical protein [Bacteroidia bacterium]
MKDTRTPTMQGPTVKPPALTNDFSEQEAQMTSSAMPPKFALTASPLNPPSDEGNANGLTPQQQADLERLGLSGDEIEALAYPIAAQILAASTRFAPEEWQQLWPTVKRLGLVSQMATILEDFYEKGHWLTSPDAVSLAMLEGFSYTNADGKKLGGFLELAQDGDRIGIRAVIPYDDFGKAIILNPRKTTTVLGRAVDAAKHPDGFRGAMNMPIGTNFVRFQKDSRVGENQGGTNVLDIADWTWAKNNAWLQAAVDRGDTIRFISDPTLPSTLFKDGKLIDGGMTVTGLELGVLLNKGLAPDKGSGNVAKFSKSDLLLHPVHWHKVKKEVVNKGQLKDMDTEAYKRFLYRSEDPDLSPKVAKDGNGNVIEFQSNFFGGTPREIVTS